ncbi:carbon monoxide dehydrogenase [Acuticoccus sediminis]|uniref:Carbon monoxide dehydrogenase n=1 Tax=Acuticoccus sediminis TaxID=2184697 RepID=A0A8B2NXH6_9HYPH|nr:2Fe-2S iron-sulfur cluster-binding protein [Acuticoccus sediminis]RAI03541.1 carbon monoxide dehydrogenase [Acuticoccus sediminis]
MTTIALTLNGRAAEADVSPRTHLADFVREAEGLTGTHLGCEHGVCGACTLYVDGRPVRSCLTSAASCDATDVRTIEGFDDDPLMARLRAAFSAHHALQCGFCTPGMLATAYDIVRRLPDADATRIREELAGNLCRCTGYRGIVEAIEAVIAEGPHMAAVMPLPRRVPQARAVPLAGAAPAVRDAPAASPDNAPHADAVLPEHIRGGETLRREIPLDHPPEAVWRRLTVIEDVVACLPGARIETREGDRFAGAFTLSIGPMRPTFRGTAAVSYDEAAHSGEVRGAGGDPKSGSRGEGIMRFTVVPRGDGASTMDVAITYRISGPLARFGRPAALAGVVDALLARFAENFTAMIEGRDEDVRSDASAFALFVAMVRRWVSGARGG